MSEAKSTWVRANWVPAPAFFKLNHACVLINKAFGGFGCYLCGSSLVRRDFRDVDVRFIMEDAKFLAEFSCSDEQAWNPRWSLLCTLISDWLSSLTGLQVDFQFQPQGKANSEHEGAPRRQALGIVLDYPGDVSDKTHQLPTPEPA